MARAGFPVHVPTTVPKRRRRIEDRPHKDPLSFCFQPQTKTENVVKLRNLPLYLNSFADNIAASSRLLSGTDALMELRVVALEERLERSFGSS